MNHFVLSLGCVSLLSAIAAAQPVSDKEDVARMQGKWRFVGGTINSKKLNEAEALLMDMMLSVKGDQIATFIRGEQKALLSFKVNVTKKPKEIDTVDMDGPSKGVKSRGIYEFDGENLKMCLRDKYNGRPGSFVVPEGVDDLFLILQREGPPPADPPPLITRMLGFSVSPVVRAAVIAPK